MPVHLYLGSVVIRIVVEVAKEDSAFVYAIFESLDGMVSFSTLAPESDSWSAARRLEVWVVPEFLSEFRQILAGLRKKFPIEEID